uniref:peptidyl-tRNA hydrolase n=1 Tax=Salvator merianae TaxID=96440 RepID=A0A8D0C0D5_SALMN
MTTPSPAYFAARPQRSLPSGSRRPSSVRHNGCSRLPWECMAAHLGLLPLVATTAHKLPVGNMAARPLVQYVVLRGDLRGEPFSWPLGALVAQACHAALAVTHAHYEHPDTAAYLEQGGSMRTVVLEAPDECALTTLAETLQRNSIDHQVWTEQPENVATCIALRPYAKEHVHHHLKKFKLLK